MTPEQNRRLDKLMAADYALTKPELSQLRYLLQLAKRERGEVFEIDTEIGVALAVDL